MGRRGSGPQRAVTVVRGAPLVRVEHLSRVIQTRAQRTVILDDVTFTVPAESLFAINGPSGSGKSTLLNMLTGIDRPTTGRVLVGGVELRASVRTPSHAGAGATWALSSSFSSSSPPSRRPKT